LAHKRHPSGLIQKKFIPKIQTSFEFDSLGFGIYLKFGFCYLDFGRLRYKKNNYIEVKYKYMENHTG
jgi:hypothetical protein